MKLKNLLIYAMLLMVTGCGCCEDEFPPGTPRDVRDAVLGVATQIDGGPVAPRQVLPIDVFFLIDDGALMAGIDAQFAEAAVLGLKPPNPNDARPHAFAAQRIMNKIKDLVAARLNALIDGNGVFPLLPNGINKDDIDFAFGVGRYEDFGGPFARRAGDAVARPFILNMPLMRASDTGSTQRDAFETSFDAALARGAPGLGGPRIGGDNFEDANSGIEALYQIATGAGFDGNGNNNTTDSGAAGSIASQTTPGNSGDVPAASYVVDGVDTDGFPKFKLASENVAASGNLGGVGWRANAARFVILATDLATVAPTGAAGETAKEPPPCPDRTLLDVFVEHPNHTLLTGDGVIVQGAIEAPYNGVHTITVIDADTYSYQIVGGAIDLRTPASGFPVVTSGPFVDIPVRLTSAPRRVPSGVYVTNGAAVGAPDVTGSASPRLGERIDICGFNASNEDSEQPRFVQGTDPNPAPAAYWRSRFGLAESTKQGLQSTTGDAKDFAGVAPLGAHTVQQTIDALNALDIEVICLAAPLANLTANDVKPTPGSTTEANGSPDSNIDEVTSFARTKTPWTWLTAVSRLTGAVMAGPAAMQSGDVENPQGTLPLVYNMADVWPFDPNAMTDEDRKKGNEALIKSTVADDLAARIYFDWLQRGFLRPTPVPSTSMQLVSVLYDLELTITPIGPQTLVRTTPADPDAFKLTRTLPADGSPLSVEFPDAVYDLFNASEDPLTAEPLPAVQQTAFQVTSTVRLAPAVAGTPTTNPEYVAAAAEVESFLKARRGGAALNVAFTHADGTAQLVVINAADPSQLGIPGALLTSTTGGCAVFNDRRVDPPGLGEQRGGTCPFPSNPDPVAATLVCPPNLVDAAQDAAGSYVPFATPEGTTVTCTRSDNEPLDARYPIGTTTVTCTDAATNETCTFDVKIEDNQSPVLTCPEFITAYSKTPEITVSALDQVNGNVSSAITGTITVLDFPSPGQTTVFVLQNPTANPDGHTVSFQAGTALPAGDHVVKMTITEGTAPDQVSSTCDFVLKVLNIP